MKILTCPSDLVKRCIWDSYVYFVLGTDKNSEVILQEDKEFEINERDALVIGLLKIIETDNLIHKFNDYVLHTLSVKSFKKDNEVLIKKKSFDNAIEKFYEKFPDHWTPPYNYKVALVDLYKYIDDLKEDLVKLDIYNLIDPMSGAYEAYNSNAIKKLLTFNNY